jgi:shikimate dehydrogenase
MKKLALVGKNIQHSKSPEIYRKILGTNIQYDLLDFEKAEDMPLAKDLLAIYDGISITSPYKKHFLPQIKLTNQAELLGAINCLKLSNGVIYGGNTDFLAIQNIVIEFINKYNNLNIIILGDGVMSDVTRHALAKFDTILFKVFSRKTVEQFDRLNLIDTFQLNFLNGNQKLVINTCSRDFVFKGLIDRKTIFWDYNYSFSQQLPLVSAFVNQYIDGMPMLELQARYALSFWSDITND